MSARPDAIGAGVSGKGEAVAPFIPFIPFTCIFVSSASSRFYFGAEVAVISIWSTDYNVRGIGIAAVVVNEWVEYNDEEISAGLLKGAASCSLAYLIAPI